MVTLTLAALAVGWLALLIVTPLLPSSLSALMYAAASIVCHQRPERSFHLDVFQLAVCARCVGIYAGAAGGCVIARLAGRPAPEGGHQAVPPHDRTGVRAATVLALLPTAVTVVLEWMGIWSPSNVTRALAGAPAGYVVALVVSRALATVHYGEWAPRRPTAPNPPPSST